MPKRFLNPLSETYGLIKSAVSSLEAQSAEEGLLVSQLEMARHKHGRSNVTLTTYLYGTTLSEVEATEFVAPTTFEEEWNMSYCEYVAYLRQKYGIAEVGYFYSDLNRSENPKFSRLNEGLFAHNLVEECAISFDELVSKDFATDKPGDLYEPRFFVYCNYFEHILLHVKIALEDHKNEQGATIGIDLSGVRQICRELNRYFQTGKCVLKHKKAADLILDQYDYYIYILWRIVNNEKLKPYIYHDDLFLDTNGMYCKKIMNDVQNNFYSNKQF